MLFPLNQCIRKTPRNSSEYRFLDGELARRGRIQSFLDQVRHVLRGNRIAALVTATKTANFLGISQATLYRKLKAEETTFGALLDEVHFELAKNCLAESALSITQVAHIVGFAESASFTRAFARWTKGTTPPQYRKSAGVDAAAGLNQVAGIRFRRL